MTILFMESGSDATQGLEFYSIASGGVSSSTEWSKTGPRSVKLLNSISQTLTEFSYPAGTNDGRISIWIKMNSATPLSRGELISFKSGANRSLLISRDSSNRLEVSEAGTPVTTGSTLNNSGVYHLAVAWTRTSSSVNELRIWVNGVLDITLSNTTWSIYGDIIVLGVGSNATSGLPYGYFDDVYMDDVSDLSFPGDIRVTAKLPAALNTNNFDTLIGSATNRYDYVSERPLSTGKGIQHAGTSDVQENFGIQGAATGDVDVSNKALIGYCGWVYGKRGDYDTNFVKSLGTANSKT